MFRAYTDLVPRVYSIGVDHNARSNRQREAAGGVRLELGDFSYVVGKRRGCRTRAQSRLISTAMYTCH